MFYFDFQFCEYRILDFMEVEHIILKQSLSINIIFYMKHTKVQYSHSFILIRRWQFSHLGTLENQHRHSQVYFTRYISFSRIHTHLYTWKEMADIICLITVWTYREVFISNNFLLQFMILFIILYWNVGNSFRGRTRYNYSIFDHL